MKSVTSVRFRNAFEKLPEPIKESSRNAYSLWQENPFHPSLNFKRVHPVKPVYSVRIGLSYRAAGIIENNQIVWFWIGSHSEYDKLLKTL